jgi:ribonucleoside-diphosphate reductase alpha chain
MKLAWTSPEAKRLNREIFENIYFAALEESILRTIDVGVFNNAMHDIEGEYPSYHGSPMSEGRFQFDLWNQSPIHTSYLDWDKLRASVKEVGIRNSLLVAPMPTASTSQILGNNECFEPFTSNIYTRRVLAGDFMVVNKYLVDELTKLNLWTADIRTQIIANNGSIQNVREIPEKIREVYKTVWEIPQKTLIDMAADRAPFICQSQSLNLFLSEPTYAKISSMHMYAWKKGLKTGCYYLRTKAPVMAQKFTIDPRMMAGSNAPIHHDTNEDDSEEDGDASSSSEDDEPEQEEQKKLRERAALRDLLAKEYEEEAKKATEEGCLMCSG